MSTCLTCGGEGTIITCCDDICVGGGHCIHGDGEEMCPDCEGEGFINDENDDGGYYAAKDNYVFEGFQCENCGMLTDDQVEETQNPDIDTGFVCRRCTCMVFPKWRPNNGMQPTPEAGQLEML